MIDTSLVYVDATPLLTRAALTGDVTAPQGNNATTLVATAGVVEIIQDAVAGVIQNGTGISWTYSDVGNTLTGNVSITQYTDELAQDAVGNLVGTGLSYDDPTGVISCTITQYTTELAQDAVGAMVGASLVYVDATPLLARAALTGDVTAPQNDNATTLVATAGVVEIIQDAVGTMVGVSLTYADATPLLSRSALTGDVTAPANDNTTTLVATAGVVAIIKTAVGPFTKAVTVELPTNAEDISLFHSDVAITITKMVAVLTGSATPSVTWTVRQGTDRSAAGTEVVTGGTTTTSVTTGSVVTSFNDATCPANSFLWLETTAKSGTVDTFNLTIYYTKD